MALPPARLLPELPPSEAESQSPSSSASHLLTVQKQCPPCGKAVRVLGARDQYKDAEVLLKTLKIY